MVHQQPFTPPVSRRQRLLSMLTAILIAVLAFTLFQPSVAFMNVQAAPPTPPGMNWSMAIYKKASKLLIASGDTMTYTIHLQIPGTTTTVSYPADVTDPLPSGLDYVPGSASNSGVYDATTRSLTWTQVPVTSAAPVDLTFDVTDTAAVTLPTPTANTATISLNGLVLTRQAWVVLMPGSTAVTPGLLASYKSADPFRLGPSDIVTYTIHLIKSGAGTATAQVSDPLPDPLTYVAGSASAGGAYDSATHTVSWSNVSVASGTPVLLTFQAQAPAVLLTPARAALIVNTATITSGGVSLKRSTGVVLTPQTPPFLAGSFKMSSQRQVAPGKQFTYTIDLNNSSAATVPATVTDPLPAQVTYVNGSANAGGVYDSATRTLTWVGLSVPSGAPLSLSFDVTANPILPTAGPGPVPGGVMITNTVSITSDADTIKRSALVWETPAPSGDNVPPVVDSLTIGSSDVLTSQDVTLDIQAHDNVGVTQMYLVEWVLNGQPGPHWQVVKSSGWIPYQASYPWTLSSQSGTHFIGVWVVDAARNRSKLTLNAIDSASLLLTGANVAQGQTVPYLVYYPAGVAVTATLTATSGEAHLFVWNPGNLFAPDQAGAVQGSTTQTVTFTTPTAGMYLFGVYGKSDAVYDLSITPGGGPRPPAPTAAPAAVTTPTLSPAAAVDSMTFNPILPQSGLDPLSVAPDPAFYDSYLPMLSH